uniref:Nucleoside diphosphate kinase A n=1 Tax=Aotus nancymaae TaxID=37293 RepID=A0A2K5DLR0_AOTNA
GHLERTFIAIKLDGMQLGLVGEIIKRFEQTGFRLVAMKFLRASKEHLKQHCIDPKDLPFVPGLVKYTNSGPVMAMMGFHHDGQAGLELLISGDPPTSASQSARITGVSHCARLVLL